MSENASQDLTILFADVAGSVELYSSLGDLKAHSRIVRFLQSMTALIERHQGVVVETIGDEIMCTFGDTENALDAACAIQDVTRGEQEQALDVRVGLHSGLTSVENGHPFGDTVNIAARVVALAKAGQIMMSDNTCQRLSDTGKSRTRYFSEVYIKDKSSPCLIHQVLWDLEDGTIMNHPSVDAGPEERRQPSNHLYLRYRDKITQLTEGIELLLGRGTQCGLRVNSEAASRIHATVKCQGGKLIFTDRSTNGTYIKTMSERRSPDDSVLFLRHDEWITNSNGVISLGKSIANQKKIDLIYFRCY